MIDTVPELPGFAFVTLAQAARIAGAAPKTFSNILSEIRAGRRPPSDLPPVYRLHGRVVVRVRELIAWLDRAATPEFPVHDVPGVSHISQAVSGALEQIGEAAGQVGGES